MTTTHVSLDLETWGTTPGCDLRSIGACVFDPTQGFVAGTPDYTDSPFDDHDTFYLATDNPRGYWTSGKVGSRFFETGNRGDQLRYPLKRDPSTVRWWSDQSAEAQGAFENPVDLKDALRRFTQWLDTLTWVDDGKTESHVERRTNLRIWCHGPAFDIPILAAAYEAVSLPVPWHYRAPRDTRTAFDMAGIVDHSAWLAQTPGPLGVSHHALDDAICQARAVCGAWERVAVMIPGEDF